MARKPANKPEPRTIWIDTREQDAFDFACVRAEEPFVLERVTLKEGDYADPFEDVTPYADRGVIERKSLADLYNSLTNDRDREQRKFARMSAYGFKALVIEADIPMIMAPNEHLAHPTQATPRSIMGTLFHWSIRYGIHVWPCPGRRAAEQLTFRLLEAWWKRRLNT